MGIGEDLQCCGAVSIPKAMGTLLGYMVLWTPWRTRSWNENLAACGKKLHLVCSWIFWEDSDPKHTSKCTQKKHPKTQNQAHLIAWGWILKDLDRFWRVLADSFFVFSNLIKHYRKRWQCYYIGKQRFHKVDAQVLILLAQVVVFQFCFF